MKNLRITYNQIEVLDIIHSFRYLPLRVLVSIAKKRELYLYRQNLGNAVLKMENNNLVKSFYYGNNWKVVYITKKGAEVLADVKGVNIKDIAVPNQGKKFKFSMLEHTVTIAELYEEFVTELQNYPQLSLTKWLGDQRMLCRYSFHSNQKGRKIRRNLIPDSYIELECEEQKTTYFLEYDTGSMDKEQLARKFMRYFEYYVYGDWKEKFGSFPSILFITDRTKKRMDNLLVKDELDLEQALKTRKHFTKAKNLVWKAIGMSDNVKSVNSTDIRGFLDVPIVFELRGERWIKALFTVSCQTILC